MKVAYSENIDRVIGTMREVGVSLEKDPSWSTVVLAPIEISGVESLEGGAATIRARFKTLPLQQGRVANELRRRLMSAFVGRGIRPYSNT
jgi:small conductance mechanosensitive channel